jgi:hypothetical protein
VLTIALVPRADAEHQEQGREDEDARVFGNGFFETFL